MLAGVGRALVLAVWLASIVVFVRVFIGAPLIWPAVALDMAAMTVPVAGLLWLRHRLEGAPETPDETAVEGAQDRVRAVEGGLASAGPRIAAPSPIEHQRAA